MRQEHFLKELEEHYPRLKEVTFTYSDKDKMTVENTPAGKVEALYFYERQDFENAVIALAYRLESRPIPPSTGAMFLNGLVDYKEMCKKKIILLSRGGYSAIPASDVGMSDEEWFEKSLLIRKHHELAHFIQRSLFPENTNILKDEIKADMAGLIGAFGYYDSYLAHLFLGIEGDEYRKGGRLENYKAENEDINQLAASAKAYIQKIEKLTVNETDPFECQIKIEKMEKE